MKIENVYIKPDGQICACTVPVPEEPKPETYGYTVGSNWTAWYTNNSNSSKSKYYKRAYKKYEAALQACKDSSVPFEDQRAIGWRLTDTAIMKGIEVDTFYSIECEVEIVDDCDCVNFDCLVPCAMADKYCNKRKVARLIPEDKEEGTAPIVEESQDELLEDLAMIALNHISGSEDFGYAINTVSFSQEVKESQEYIKTDQDFTNIGNASSTIRFLSEYIHGVSFNRRKDLNELSLRNALDCFNRITRKP